MMISFSAALRRAVLPALFVCTVTTPVTYGATSELDALRSSFKGMQEQLQKALQRIEQLEKEKTATSSRVERVEKSVKSSAGAASALNPAIGVVIDTTAEHRSTVGGTFNFRAAELGLAASIDPYARGYAIITGSREGVEVEEAAMVTTSLPWNLQARGGRFFADFGRLAKFHPHEYAFVNSPLSLERIVGGESKADGVELSYLFSTPFFLRATLGGYNKIGAENERLDDSKSRSWSRFTYLARLNTYADLTDNHNLELGTSMAYTPSVRLVDIGGSTRNLVGLDLTYRYQPLGRTTDQSVTWGNELFVNSERRAKTYDDGRVVGRRRNAFGGYSYAEWQFNRNWATGFLFDYAPSIDSPGKKTKGYSPFLTWSPSEFNRLRFQFTHLSDMVREEKAERGNQVFLQWTTVLGSHTHGFRTR
ncbi:MAG: hypothetical protein FJ145_00555 [Deltaproteobacteria bacterium]|nr:hypothetical protein [Deltaproteobacteria bacterium]